MSEVAESVSFLDKREGIDLKRSWSVPCFGHSDCWPCVLLLSFLNENFFTLKNIISVLRQSTILVVVAVGMTVSDSYRRNRSFRGRSDGPGWLSHLPTDHQRYVHRPGNRLRTRNRDCFLAC